MSFGFNDIFSTDTLMGGLGGAVTGGLAGGIPGAVAGGGLGAAGGAYKHYAGEQEDKRGNAYADQRASVDEAMKQLRELSRKQYAQRMQDLERGLAMYGPAEDYLKQIAVSPHGPAAPGAARPGSAMGGLQPPPGMGPPPGMRGLR